MSASRKDKPEAEEEGASSTAATTATTVAAPIVSPACEDSTSEADSSDSSDDSSDDGDSDIDEDDNGSPYTQGTTFRIPVAKLNFELTCPICHGYFREAFTLIEACQHTFCKSCVLKWFHAGNTTCPAGGCGRNLGYVR
mgnify:CR=1 FL=1